MQSAVKWQVTRGKRRADAYPLVCAVATGLFLFMPKDRDGGEAPGAWVFVAEHARRGRVGFAVGLLTSGLSLGILLGSLMATCLNRVFSQAQIAAGAWRIPFLIGGVFGFVAMWLRRWLKETPIFEEMRKRATLSRELPLGAALKNHGRAVATSIVSTWMLTASIVVVILMTPSLIPKLFGIAPTQVQMANLVATATLCVSTLVIGAATDRFGIRRVAIPILLLLIASTYGLYLGAETMPFALLPLYALAGYPTIGISAARWCGGLITCSIHAR
jgi:MFS family permease